MATQDKDDSKDMTAANMWKKRGQNQQARESAGVPVPKPNPKQRSWAPKPKPRPTRKADTPHTPGSDAPAAVITPKAKPKDKPKDKPTPAKSSRKRMAPESSPTPAKKRRGGGDSDQKAKSTGKAVKKIGAKNKASEAARQARIKKMIARAGRPGN
jgi:hypothetical protein